MDEILQQAMGLISLKTTGPGECKVALKQIEGYLKPTRWVIRHYESNHFPSMVVSPDGGKEFKFMLMGHVDVVPGNQNQFTPKVIGNRLYGRGAIDMKSQVAAMVVLVKRLAKLKPSMALMLTSDEEQGGANGAKFLLEKGFSCGFFIAPDGGTNFRLITREKGVLWLEIIARGKAGHGSTPWTGENAIEILMEKLRRIGKLFNNRNAWSNTISIGKIKGGHATNQIPDRASALIDVRYTKDPEGLLASIGKIAEYKISQRSPPLSTSQNHPEVKRLSRAMGAVLGKNATPGFEHGASDARYFAERGIPGAIFNPEGAGAHSKDEYLVIPSLKKFYRILELFVTEAK